MTSELIGPKHVQAPFFRDDRHIVGSVTERPWVIHSLHTEYRVRSEGGNSHVVWVVKRSKKHPRRRGNRFLGLAFPATSMNACFGEKVV